MEFKTKPVFPILLLLLSAHCGLGGSRYSNPDAPAGTIGASCGGFFGATCSDGQNCTDNGCEACGEPDQPCCTPVSSCSAGHTCTGPMGSGEFCSGGRRAADCGLLNQPCCVPGPWGDNRCSASLGLICNPISGFCGSSQCTGPMPFNVDVVPPTRCESALVPQYAASAAAALSCYQAQHPQWTVTPGTVEPTDLYVYVTDMVGCSRLTIRAFSEDDALVCARSMYASPDAMVSSDPCPPG